MTRRVVVYHSYYGCDTGCCGHAIDINGNESGFTFDHPWKSEPETEREFVERVVTEECGADHVADIDWDLTLVTDTC